MNVPAYEGVNCATNDPPGAIGGAPAAADIGDRAGIAPMPLIEPVVAIIIPPSSMLLCTGIPCQWTVVASGKWLLTVIATGSPAVSTMSGPRVPLAGTLFAASWTT
jgi:hypothetical protein